MIQYFGGLRFTYFKMTEKVDIAILKTDLKYIKKELHEIKTNHIKHINDRLYTIDCKQATQDKKQAYYSGAIAVILVVVEIILKFIFR